MTFEIETRKICTPIRQESEREIKLDKNWQCLFKKLYVHVFMYMHVYA